ncbi:MAG: MauE/DoxX family redox-associated membrane protein, partial [Longimicrobiales bacterium]
MRRTPLLNAIRFFLAVVFIVYGLTKLLGGQFNYGDWTLDKKTVDGTSLVWAFYGYSPVYARFLGLTELIPAILLLIPRTATVGALMLFMVTLNVTVLDFAFGFPSVKYFALLYTLLLGMLLWSDRAKLLRLLERAPSNTVVDG